MNTSEAIAMMSLLFLDYDTQRIHQDLENRTKYEYQILNTVFQRTRYDSRNPTNAELSGYVPSSNSDYPVNLDLRLLITHFEELTWNDTRIYWDERDFGNITTISRLYFELQRIWLPKIHVFQLTRKQSPLLEDYLTRITFNNKNQVHARVTVNMRAPCVFDFTEYPYDSQSCVFAIYGSESFQRVRFRSATTRVQPRDVFGIEEGSDEPFQIGDYYVNTVETQRVLVTSSYGVASDERDPKVVDALVRVKVIFSRLPYYYLVSIALPVFCIAVVTYLVATVQAPQLSLIWLLISSLAQVLIFWQMVHKLPPDHKRAPNCAIVAAVIFGETLVLFCYRAIITYFKLRCQKPTPQRILGIIETFMKIFLALHCFVNAYFLFL